VRIASVLGHFALSISLILGSALLHANPLEDARLAGCLKGWDLNWQFPYYPKFQALSCPAEETQVGTESPLFAGLPIRRQKLDLAYQSSWFPRPPGAQSDSNYREQLRLERPRVAYQHFDRLFLAQQFRRVEGPREWGDPPERIPTFAAYEKAVPNGVLRVELNISRDRFGIVLDQRGTVRADAALPVPTDGFDIADHGVHAKLFEIPGLKLIEETVRFDQVMVPLPAAQVPANGDNPLRIYAPMRQFKFELDRKAPAAELEAAYRELLTRAGWKPVTDSELTGNQVYRHTLRNRSIDVSIRAGIEYETRPPIAFATVGEPSSWPDVIPVLGLAERGREWEIAPRFEPGGRPSAATRREIFVFAAHTDAPTKTSSILVVPVVSAELQSDATAARNARVAAKWVADELVKRSFDAARVRVFEDIKTPTLKKFNVTVGARVTFLRCRTVNDTRPGRTEERCDCSADFGVVSTNPGICK
jgi:hypothetical protein